MKEEVYIKLLSTVKEQIRQSQVRAVSAANSQMLLLYWKLGRSILLNQMAHGWGAKIIESLSRDIRKEFPKLKGFSVRNMMYMKQFAESYPPNVIEVFNSIQNELNTTVLPSQTTTQRLLSIENISHSITQQAVALIQNPTTVEDDILFLSSIVAKISWSHHVVLMDKLPDLGKRLWYMLNTLEHGNSRNILMMQIESGLFERQIASKKVNNFKNTLPPTHSDFANYLLKDPYIFDFVQAQDKANERNIEEQLSHHITKFLLELGQGFAFMGRQVHFEIGNSDFFVDLLFYHTKLHCYVVVELKARPFEPGDAGQLNFYVNVVNDKLKGEQDNDTIGLLLCKGKNEVLAEYALKGYNAALGISDYQLSKAIPSDLLPSLPQIEDLENELTELP